jgi:hypothetical protein
MAEQQTGLRETRWGRRRPILREKDMDTRFADDRTTAMAGRSASALAVEADFRPDSCDGGGAQRSSGRPAGRVQPLLARSGPLDPERPSRAQPAPWLACPSGQEAVGAAF